MLRLVTCEAGDVLEDVRNTKNFLDYSIGSLFNRYSGLQSSDVMVILEVRQSIGSCLNPMSLTQMCQVWS